MPRRTAPVGSSWATPDGRTGRAHVGVAHDLPTVALENAARFPPPLGQSAPARRATLSYRLRARVAHIPHSPRHDRILDFSVEGPRQRPLDPKALASNERRRGGRRAPTRTG